MVWVGNGGIDMNLVDVPVGLLPVHVAYVANAPISNSFGLKYETGGGGATISFDGGGPAKETTACEARVTTAKTAIFFMCLSLSIKACLILGIKYQPQVAARA